MHIHTFFLPPTYVRLVYVLYRLTEKVLKLGHLAELAVLAAAKNLTDIIKTFFAGKVHGQLGSYYFVLTIYLVHTIVCIASNIVIRKTRPIPSKPTDQINNHSYSR